MNKQFILKSGFSKQIFLNGNQQKFKFYFLELIDKNGIKISQNIKILLNLSIEEQQIKINKNLNKLIKSYFEIKNKNLHLYK